MKAMILAAGRGNRMHPLTDHLPKPLLKINDKSLIEYHIENLVAAGINDLIINHAWLGHKIEEQLGNGSRYGASIYYSKEEQALETAGGIQKVLPLFDDQPFIVINGDIFTDYPISQLMTSSRYLSPFSEDDSILAHLILVNNPPHNHEGDFYCDGQRVYHKYDNDKNTLQKYTFSGMACYHPDFFYDLKAGKQALAPLFHDTMEKQQVSGEVYSGHWCDIGTPQRLKEIQALYDMP